RGAQSLPDRESAADVARSPQVLGEDREGILSAGFDDDVESLRGGNAELIDGDRVHILPIGRDHGHLQPRDAYVEMRHRRPVDETEADLLAGTEEAGPVAQC